MNKIPLYTNMKPYGILKTTSDRCLIKEKIKYLKQNRLSNSFIKGYLIAQGHSDKEIRYGLGG